MITGRVHWLSITIEMGLNEFMEVIYKKFFHSIFGELVPTGRGGMGYRASHKALQGVMLYSANISKELGVHFSLPGEACDCLHPSVMIAFAKFLDAKKITWACTRVDLAIDGGDFSPKMFYEELVKDDFTSLAKREEITFIVNPFMPSENYKEYDPVSNQPGEGFIGLETVTLGTRSSQRMLRVYNLHGFTRVEMQTRNERADIIFKMLVVAGERGWLDMMFYHIRQYAELEAEWWQEFCQDTIRGNVKITSAKENTHNRMMAWHRKQVASSLYVISVVDGLQAVSQLIDVGEMKVNENREKHGRSRYDVILKLAEVGADWG